MAKVFKQNLRFGNKATPHGFYNLAITDAKHEKAKATGNDMCVLDMEIIGPAEIEQDGAMVPAPVGNKSKIRITVTAESGPAMEQLTCLLGTDIEDGVDSAELCAGAAEELKGKVLLDVELENDPYYETEQGTFKPIKGADGNPILKGNNFKLVRKARWPKAVTREEAGLPA